MTGREPYRKKYHRGLVRHRLLPAPTEWRVVRDARLTALRDAPESFLPRHPPEPSWKRQDWRGSWTSGIWAIAEAGRRPVGLARLSRVDAEAYVESVWTHPRYRRRGVASALVRMLVAHERAAVDDIFVWVIHPNPAALKLYTALGFESTNDVQLLEPLNRVEERLRFSGGNPPD